MESATPRFSPTTDVFYERVDFFVEITEAVEMNQTTPLSEPPGVGTGLCAWHIAERVLAALSNWPVEGLAAPYRVFARGQGIVNETRTEDVENGLKVVRVLLATACQSLPRHD